MNNLITSEDIDIISRMSKAFAEGQLFGLRNSGEAFTLMSIAQANGLHPAKALERYHIINGRPAMKAEAMLASFQEAGGKTRWIERNDKKCTLHLEHPQAGELDVTWDTDRAETAGLNSTTWKKYPAQMLSARCISEGVRALYPACLGGMYTIEEEEQIAIDKAKELKAKVNVITKETPTKAPSKMKADAVEAELVKDSPYNTNTQPLFTHPPKSPDNALQKAENKTDNKTDTPQAKKAPTPLNDKKKADFLKLVETAKENLGVQTVDSILNNFGGFDEIVQNRDTASEVALLLKPSKNETALQTGDYSEVDLYQGV